MYELRPRGRPYKDRCKLCLSSALLFVVGSLVACQSPTSDQALAPGYPSLQSVPSAPRPSASVDERRQIVEGLIRERNESLRQTSIVRRRSGLSISTPETLSDPGWDAEEIVPEDAEQDGDPFSLTSQGKGESADSVYRDKTRFEDGGLDDFIRSLKRDTNPFDQESEGETEPDAVEEEPDLSARDAPALDHNPSLTMLDSRHVLLASVAPVIAANSADMPDVIIRLAAADDDDSGFCEGMFGWTISWSGICDDDQQRCQHECPDEMIRIRMATRVGETGHLPTVIKGHHLMIP